MLRYALARIVWTIPVILVAITLTFFLVRSIGGDPFRHGPLVGLAVPTSGWQKYGDYQPRSIRENMRRQHGLDLPWYEQYGNYLASVATFSPPRSPSATGRWRRSSRRRGRHPRAVAAHRLRRLRRPIGLASALAARLRAAAGEGPLRRRAGAAGVPRRHAPHLRLRGPRRARPDVRLGRLARQDPADGDAGARPLAFCAA